MSFRNRLKHLEHAAWRAAPPRQQHRLTLEEWLDLFEDLGRERHFDAEPDFPKALEFYREALQRAKLQTDPPWDPPADFMPNLADLPDLRVDVNWRDSRRFPAVWEGWQWLCEMHERVTKGIPPVAEDDFHELTDWLETNADRLWALKDRSGLLDLGNGRQTTVTELLSLAREGPRAYRPLDYTVGQLAEDLRRLRARLGDE